MTNDSRFSFRVPVGESGEAPHTHSHRQVLALHVGRADIVAIKTQQMVAAFRDRPRLWRRCLDGSAIRFHDHGVVDVPCESRVHGVDVNVKAVGAQLDAVIQPAFQIAHEGQAIIQIAAAYSPARNQLSTRHQSRSTSTRRQSQTGRTLASGTFFALA